jgi:chloramphenicol-sensitive protein RarD
VAGGAAPSDETASRAALGAGVLCYLIWGVAPLFFQATGRIGADSWEILAHRAVWGAVTAGVFVVISGQGRQVAEVLRSPDRLALLALSGLLIGGNWALYVWGVNAGKVLESSLGYYLTPLLNMVAGALIFRERFDRIGLLAIGLAGIGVVLQGLALGHFPWIAVVLALLFAAYGVVRKQINADAQTGLFVETLFLAVPGLAWMIFLGLTGRGHFDDSPAAAAWLLAAGPYTAIPLVLFSWAARRMPLSAMGFLQFIGPTIGFSIGLSQGEPFTVLRGVSFGFIWLGAAAFLYGAWRRTRVLAR